MAGVVFPQDQVIALPALHGARREMSFCLEGWGVAWGAWPGWKVGE